MSEHTRHDWRPEPKEGSENWAIVGEDYGEVATVWNPYDYLGTDGEELIASAREETAERAALIAAAPELLGAAAEIDRLCLVILSAVHHDQATSYPAVVAAITGLRAAIALATPSQKEPSQ